MRVLVVDDLAEMRALVSRILSGNGYAVDVAATVGQARSLNPASYDVLLVDAHLGRDLGTDLIYELAAEDPAAASRCVVMTGDTTSGIPAGTAVLAKPFEFADLIEAVRAVPARVPASAAPAPRIHMTGSAPRRAAPDVSSGLLGWAQPAFTRQLINLIHRLRAHDLGEVAGALHDGPAQDLCAAMLALELASRSAPADLRGRLEEILGSIASAAASLRRLSQARALVLAGQVEVADALRQQTTVMLGQPADVVTNDSAAPVEVEEAAAIVTVVELLLTVVAERQVPAKVTVTSDEHAIAIDLTIRYEPADGLAEGDLAAELAALDGLARALGGRAVAESGGHDWRTHMVLRRRPPAASRRSASEVPVSAAP
jgi:CheY-like chemotaxis protein